MSHDRFAAFEHSSTANFVIGAWCGKCRSVRATGKTPPTPRLHLHLRRPPSDAIRRAEHFQRAISNLLHGRWPANGTCDAPAAAERIHGESLLPWVLLALSFRDVRVTQSRKVSDNIARDLCVRAHECGCVNVYFHSKVEKEFNFRNWGYLLREGSYMPSLICNPVTLRFSARQWRDFIVYCWSHANDIRSLWRTRCSWPQVFYNVIAHHWS